MSVRASLRSRAPLRARASLEASRGDLILRGLCVGAGALVVLALADLVYEIVHGAAPAFDKYGLGFLGHTEWAPNFKHFGAAVMLFGTAVTSAMALLIAAPLSIAIGIYLAMLAPRTVRAVVGPVVEMLAAIPSVIFGFWGIIVFAPFIAQHVEPPLHSVLGWTGLFGTPQATGVSLLTASVILAVMIIPIIASLSRDLFLSVPSELKDGAEALGATRWEVIRGIVIPTTFAGVVSAAMLGLGRALGEALAVALTIGGANVIHGDLFGTGNTLAAQVALQIQFLVNKMHGHALYYLALILLVIGVTTNLLARVIARRYSATLGL
jgi:phosphate transport system permease protein